MGCVSSSKQDDTQSEVVVQPKANRGMKMMRKKRRRAQKRFSDAHDDGVQAQEDERTNGSPSPPENISPEDEEVMDPSASSPNSRAPSPEFLVEGSYIAEASFPPQYQHQQQTKPVDTPTNTTNTTSSNGEREKKTPSGGAQEEQEHQPRVKSEYHHQIPANPLLPPSAAPPQLADVAAPVPPASILHPATSTPKRRSSLLSCSGSSRHSSSLLSNAEEGFQLHGCSRFLQRMPAAGKEISCSFGGTNDPSDDVGAADPELCALDPADFERVYHCAPTTTVLEGEKDPLAGSISLGDHPLSHLGHGTASANNIATKLELFQKQDQIDIKERFQRVHLRLRTQYPDEGRGLMWPVPATLIKKFDGEEEEEEKPRCGEQQESEQHHLLSLAPEVSPTCFRYLIETKWPCRDERAVLSPDLPESPLRGSTPLGSSKDSTLRVANSHQPIEFADDIDLPPGPLPTQHTKPETDPLALSEPDEEGLNGCLIPGPQSSSVLGGSGSSSSNAPPSLLQGFVAPKQYQEFEDDDEARRSSVASSRSCATSSLGASSLLSFSSCAATVVDTDWHLTATNFALVPMSFIHDGNASDLQNVSVADLAIERRALCKYIKERLKKIGEALKQEDYEIVMDFVQKQMKATRRVALHRLESVFTNLAAIIMDLGALDNHERKFLESLACSPGSHILLEFEKQELEERHRRERKRSTQIDHRLSPAEISSASQLAKGAEKIRPIPSPPKSNMSSLLFQANTNTLQRPSFSTSTTSTTEGRTSWSSEYQQQRTSFCSTAPPSIIQRDPSAFVRYLKDRFRCELVYCLLTANDLVKENLVRLDKRKKLGSMRRSTSQIPGGGGTGPKKATSLRRKQQFF